VGHPQWELSAASVNSHGQVAVNAPFEVGGIVDSLPAVLDPEDTNGDGTPDTWYRDTNGDGFNDLIQPLGFSFLELARAINELGWVCGDDGGEAFLVIPLDLNGDGRGDCWYADEDGDGVNDLVFYLSNYDERASVAFALNDAGEIVGRFTDYDPVPHIPFKTDIYGQIAVLEDSQDWAEPHGINNLSQAVGWSGYPTFSAVMWEADRSMRVLFPGNRKMDARAADINDLGQVAITTTDFRDRHVAYVLDSATMTILGENPGVVVSGINNHGYLSGHVFITNPDPTKPDLARACVLLPPTP